MGDYVSAALADQLKNGEDCCAMKNASAAGERSGRGLGRIPIGLGLQAKNRPSNKL